MCWKLHLYRYLFNFSLFLLFLILMVSFKIGSLNVNGCRDVRKRSTLFKYLQLKKADVILLLTLMPVMRSTGKMNGRAVLVLVMVRI